MENPFIAKLDELKGNRFAPTATASYTGVAIKEFGLVLLVAASAFVTWGAGYANVATTAVAGIMGFICCMAISFKPAWASFLTPLYAILEGMFIACVSALAEGAYPGVVIQAVMMTFGLAAAAALVYSRGLITVDGTFIKIVSMVMVGLLFSYLGRFVLEFFFNVNFSILDGGIIGIAVDVLLIGLASACLLIDYESVNQAVSAGMPKEYEWFCAFSLLVTLIWLYVRCLDLLMTIARSDD